MLGNAASLHTMTLLMVDSRRLMMLATMEAALAPGGIVPVVAYFRHSMIVVFPEPFWPRMSVSGFWKSIACHFFGSGVR